MLSSAFLKTTACEAMSRDFNMEAFKVDVLETFSLCS